MASIIAMRVSPNFYEGCNFNAKWVKNCSFNPALLANHSPCLPYTHILPTGLVSHFTASPLVTVPVTYRTQSVQCMSEGGSLEEDKGDGFASSSA